MNYFESYEILKSYRKDPIGFIQNMSAKNGEFSHLNVFGKHLFIVSNPDDVMFVLKSNHQAYSKGRTTKMLQKFLGRGLITNDDMKSWRKQHRLIRPMMNLKSIFQLAPKIDEVVQKFVQDLDISKEVNIFHEMNRLTWRIILKTLFSQESNKEMETWLHEILELMEIVTRKTRSSLPLPFWIPTKDNKRLREIIFKFDHYVYELIRERKKSGKKDDLIQLLIDAREENDSMNEREIRDEVMTFLMAGHETITNSMSWLLIETAKNSKYDEKLKNEAHEFLLKKDFHSLMDSPWLGASIDEAMRLWPPVWVFMRQAEYGHYIRNFFIPPKANVVLAPFLTHRCSTYWDHPLEFRPERFIDKKKIHPGAFYPFGAGPRACIGMYFAGMEARIIFSHFIHQFSWKIINEKKQEFVPGITLRPSNNIMMKFQKRFP